MCPSWHPHQPIRLPPALPKPRCNQASDSSRPRRDACKLLLLAPPHTGLRFHQVWGPCLLTCRPRNKRDTAIYIYPPPCLQGTQSVLDPMSNLQASAEEGSRRFSSLRGNRSQAPFRCVTFFEFRFDSFSILHVFTFLCQNTPQKGPKKCQKA